MEGPIDLSNNVRRAPGDILIGDVVCVERAKPESIRDEIGRTIQAGQELHGPIVESGQAVGRSGELEIRDVRQLIVPPRGVNGSVRS